MDEFYYLISIFEDVDLFLLILVRLIGFFVIMPIFSGTNIPNTIKMAFAIGFAFMVHTVGLSDEAIVFFNNSLISYLWLLLIEFLVGFTMAYVVYIVMSLLYLMGQFIDDSIGFNMVSVLDPSSQIQVPVMGNLLYLMAISILIISGGLHIILMSVFQSFQLAPIGTISFLNAIGLMQYVLSLIITTFYMGLQIAMPIVGSIIVINLALGMLLKTMPQMNMFVVGMPLKLILGLLIITFLLPIFAVTFNAIFNLAYNAVESVIMFFSDSA